MENVLGFMRKGEKKNREGIYIFYILPLFFAKIHRPQENDISSDMRRNQTSSFLLKK